MSTTTTFNALGLLLGLLVFLVDGKPSSCKSSQINDNVGQIGPQKPFYRKMARWRFPDFVRFPYGEMLWNSDFFE